MRRVASSLVQPAISYQALVGHVIERYRKAGNLGQEALAGALGISQSAYSRLEQGQSAMSVSQLRLIAANLGLTPGALLTEADVLVARLQAQGVEVSEEKPESQAGLLVALGILTALLAASR